MISARLNRSRPDHRAKIRSRKPKILAPARPVVGAAQPNDKSDRQRELPIASVAKGQFHG